MGGKCIQQGETDFFIFFLFIYFFWNFTPFLPFSFTVEPVACFFFFNPFTARVFDRVL